MTTLEIEEFKHSIINYINKSTLPMAVKRMVIDEIGRDVTKAADEELRVQIQDREASRVDEKGDK